MASLRSTEPGPTGPPDPADPSDGAILAAARELVAQVGVRRTTATEVARRAGVSRMTLYRRFSDVESLLVTLLTQEVRALLADLAGQTAGLATARERLVETALLGIDRLAADPLFARLVDLDPELLLPYLLERAGSSHHAARAALAGTLAEGRADGSIRPLPEPAASWMLLVVIQSFVYAARMLAKETDPAAVHDELRRLLDGYLRP
jgi:AcrR family transcriptional regulator